MDKVLVKVPGSCGELIQGFYGGCELLVSYAIDCYSTVSLEVSEQYKLSINHQNEKAVIAFHKACELFGLESSHFSIDISSDIPVGKGMASSTADIVGVLTAVATYAGKAVDPVWLGEIAAQIEPTDNIMFGEWVLFNHLKGEVVESLHNFGDLSVLVLEMDDMIDTRALRNAGAFSKSNKPSHSRALSILKDAVKERDLTKLGEAMSLSAVENQIVLEKPYLLNLITLAKECGMVGVNTSHSGTVLGVVFESDKDPNEFLSKAQDYGFLKPYKRRYIHKIIKGGPVIEIY